MIEGGPKISATILGSGTCVPSLKRSSCSILVEAGTEKILLDIGPGTMRRLLEAQTTIFEISHLFISHFHPDHSSELVPFLFATKYPDAAQRRFPLRIVSGKGVSAFYGKLKNAFGAWVELAPGLLEIIELNNAGRARHVTPEFTLETIPVMHNPESLACRITIPSGNSIVYSGDTDYNENLIALAKDTDLFICESAFPDDLKTNGHLTPSLAGKIATFSNVKKLVLTHLYPECDMTDIENECRKTYNGPLILAYDLLKIEIT